MEIIKKIAGDELYIKPMGRIDINTAASFGETIDDALDESINNLILDFDEIVYISSIGLRVLLEFQKRMVNPKTMKIINVKSEVMEVFTMTGFNKILTII